MDLKLKIQRILNLIAMASKLEAMASNLMSFLYSQTTSIPKSLGPGECNHDPVELRHSETQCFFPRALAVFLWLWRLGQGHQSVSCRPQD